MVIWLVLVEIQFGLDFILYSFTGRDQTHDNVLEEWHASIDVLKARE